MRRRGNEIGIYIEEGEMNAARERDAVRKVRGGVCFFFFFFFVLI